MQQIWSAFVIISRVSVLITKALPQSNVKFSSRPDWESKGEPSKEKDSKFILHQTQEYRWSLTLIRRPKLFDLKIIYHKMLMIRENVLLNFDPNQITLCFLTPMIGFSDEHWKFHMPTRNVERYTNYSGKNKLGTERIAYVQLTRKKIQLRSSSLLATLGKR